jgi:hypothetical protein
MATPENIERLKTRRKDIADAEAAGEGDAVEGFMPQEQSEFESREDYRGYKMPKGMSLPQRRKWKQAIDEREGFASKTARQLPRQVEDFKQTVRGVGRSAKEVGKEMFKEAAPLPGMAKGVGEFAVDAALTVPRAKAAMYTDPEGSKEFMKAVASGDREARKQLATGASESMVEPFATFGDIAMTKYAAEEGDTETAALYGGLILAPFALQTLGKSMSKGWLKSATEAGEEIPDEAAKKLEDLAKRVDEGKVTDDMQVRRELAGIEDTHMVEYAKSRPIEDPLQKGGPEPGFLAPDARYDYDREPPGYMGMSRSNQPMSRFSEGHERFIDELRTDMAEDTNFGELSGRFYNDLESIDKREDLLRSTGKDARGRQLDDIEISNEYEKLSKERQSLADEYYVAKAEREAALRFEGSYVPPGAKTSLAGEPVGPPGGKPPGGGGFKDQADQLIRELDELSFSGMQRSGLDMQPQSVLRKRLDDLRDRIEQAPPEVREEIFRRARMTSQGINPAPFTETIGQLGLVDDIRGGNPLVGKPPGGPPRPGPAKIQRMDESGLYPGGQEYKLFSPRTDSIYKGGNVIQTSAYGPSDLRIGDMFETKYHDGRPAIGVMKADGVDLFPPDGQDARRLSDIVKKRHGKPQLAFPDAAGEIQYYEDQYSMGKRGSDEFDLERGGTPGGGRVSAFTEDDGIDKYKQLVMQYADEGRPFSFTEVFEDPSQPFDLDLYKAVDELVAEGRISGPSPFDDNVYDEFGRTLNHNTMVYTKTPGGGGGRSIDDIEGPSEAEIQQMVETSKFGDPEELEMLKEDMRRLAQAEQQGQIESGRVRRSRTPGAAGASGKVPEGTSRAERKGTPRERPKKKD